MREFKTLSLLTIAEFLGGLGLLLVGAEVLVRGAARLAAAVGISSLVVGLTVVAIGTSAPELAVTIKSGLSGKSDIGLGNLIGSNICNILLVLGLSAVIGQLGVATQIVRIDIWVMILAGVAVASMSIDGVVDRLDGVVLATGAVAYTMFCIYVSRRENARINAAYAKEFGGPKTPMPTSWLWNGVLVAGGLGLLVLGADWLVDAAVALARSIGMSQRVIGLTVVAIGTSAPEIATSVMAGLKGQRDIAVGNVIGSCVFNLLAILGLGAVASPGGLLVSRAAMMFDIPVMMASAFLCIPVFFTGLRIARLEGLLFLLYYAAYTTYLVLDAKHSRSMDDYRTVMLYGVIPCSLVPVGLSVTRSLRAARQRSRQGSTTERT
ncbi:MAG: sodium:calcium antiporter [Planctomycetia bacterium]